MGFGATICIYPKYKDRTLQDVLVISKLLEYERETWAQNNYSSAEDYAKSFDYLTYSTQPQDAIDFYRENIYTDEYGYKHLHRDFPEWCSNGSGDIYNFITNLGSQINDDPGYRLLSRADVVKVFNFCLDHVLDNLPKECVVTHAFTYEKDETGSVIENGKITLIPCDGVEIQFTDEENRGKIERLETNPEWDCYTGFPSKYYDEWTESGYIEGVRGCADLLSQDNLENYFVVYSGGW